MFVITIASSTNTPFSLLYSSKPDYEMNWPKNLVFCTAVLNLKFRILRIFHLINYSSHHYRVMLLKAQQQTSAWSKRHTFLVTWALPLSPIHQTSLQPIVSLSSLPVHCGSLRAQTIINFFWYLLWVPGTQNT